MLLEEYKKYYEATLTVGTLKRYVREIEAFIEVTDPSCSTYNDLSEYFCEVPEKIANVVKAALISYFNFLIIKGLRIDNPVKTVVVKKQSKEINHSLLLSSDQLDVIVLEREQRYEVLKWRNLLLLSLVRYQALTNSDLLNLEITSIQKGELKVRSTATLNENNYKLEPIQVEYFYEYKSIRSKIIREDTDVLFLNKRGMKITGDGITSVIDTLKPLFPEYRIHNKIIRQSVITEFAKKTDDLLKTQKFARHKWSSSTNKYFDFISDELRNEIEEKHPFNLM